MPRRRRHDVVAVAIAALACAAAACQADSGDAGCQLAPQQTLPGTPLTLLANARLDQVGGGYFLLGNDDTALRWGAVSADGSTLTGEQSYALPSEATALYYAMAGLESPGDTVLLGYLRTATSGTGAELAVLALPVDGSPPSAPAVSAQPFPGGFPAATSVAMISSRAGMNAGLAWIDDSAGRVMVTSLDGTGTETTAGGIATSSAATPPFQCLQFSPGKDDLTVVYFAAATGVQVQGGGASLPGWIIAETNEGGSVDSSTTLAFTSSSSANGCAQIAPTQAGYGITWRDGEGYWLANYTAQGNMLAGPYLFASASSFGGASLEPPLSGLAPFGTDYGVLLSRPFDVELWRLDDMGDRHPGALIFPSVDGVFGQVSALPPGNPAVPSMNGLVVTYADYTSASGVTPATGSRIFANAVCY
ncbi:MAG TPA: hypothetical protein VN853_17715 [Polyangia bacterium]|nr:hypothetical protein [Polyangia bacterium]